MGFVVAAVKWGGGIIEGAVEGTVEGVKQIFDGNIVEGFLNVVTFGVYGNVKDYIDRLQPETPEANYQSRKAMATGAQTPKQAVYGTARVGGQLVYIESTGTDSQYLHMIVVVAPHKVQGIQEIYFNDELAFNSSGTAQGVYSGKAEVIKVLGTQTAANGTLVSRLSGWTTDHKLQGMAYVYLRLTYDDEVYSRGTPQVSCVVLGKNDIYDPRTGTSYFTDNHALCLLDYLQWEKGVRATDAEVDMASFIAAANVSDELVPANTAGTVTEKRYTLNGTVSFAASIVDNLNSMSRAGASTLSYSQGAWYIVPGKYVAPVASFDESDLVGGVQFTPGPGKNNISNTAKGSYIDAAQNYEAVDFVPISPSSYVTQDGEELAVEIPMPFADSATLARRLAKINIERERFGVKATVTLKYKAMTASVGDRISLSIARLGWVNKVFRIEEATLSVNGGVNLALSEDAAAVWDWTEGEALTVTPPPALSLPVRPAIAAPTGLALSLEVNQPRTPKGNMVTIYYQAIAPADTRFGYIRFQYRLQGDDQWIDPRYDVAASGSISVFADGLTYEVSAQSVSVNGVVSESRLIDTVTVPVVSEDPLNTNTDDPAIQVPDVTGLSLSNPGATVVQWIGPNAEFEWNKISLSGQPFQDLHLAYYLVEIRDSATGTLRRAANVNDTFYVYTLEKNIEDGNGTPVRGIHIDVTAIARTGKKSTPIRLTVSNPSPSVVSGVSVIYTKEGIELSYTPPGDTDFRGIKVRGKLFTGSSITLEPMTTRAETLSIISVDEFGDGATLSYAITNPAPAAPALAVKGVGFTSGVINIGYPDDYDLIGADVRFRTGGATPGVWSTAVRITANEVTLEGLVQGTGYDVEVTPVDTLGVGTAAVVSFTTDSIDTADVSGLSNWATETNPVDLAFINANMANNAMPSDKIANLTAAKITAGEISVQVDLGTGVRLDGTNGYVQTLNNGYSVYMGPVTRATLSANPLVLHDWNAGLSESTFWFDLAGNFSLGKGGIVYDVGTDVTTFSGALSAATGTFAGSLSAATGTFGDVPSGQYIEFSGGSLDIGYETSIGGVDSYQDDDYVYYNFPIRTQKSDMDIIDNGIQITRQYGYTEITCAQRDWLNKCGIFLGNNRFNKTPIKISKNTRFKFTLELKRLDFTAPTNDGKYVLVGIGSSGITFATGFQDLNSFVGLKLLQNPSDSYQYDIYLNVFRPATSTLPAENIQVQDSSSRSLSSYPSSAQVGIEVEVFVENDVVTMFIDGAQAASTSSTFSAQELTEECTYPMIVAFETKNTDSLGVNMGDFKTAGSQ